MSLGKLDVTLMKPRLAAAIVDSATWVEHG